MILYRTALELISSDIADAAYRRILDGGNRPYAVVTREAEVLAIIYAIDSGLVKDQLQAAVDEKLTDIAADHMLMTRIKFVEKYPQFA